MSLQSFNPELPLNSHDGSQFHSHGLTDPTNFNPFEAQPGKGVGVANYKEIAFVDPTVTNYQSLIAGLDSSIAVMVLDAYKDGVQQITDALKDGNFSAVHIISQGSPGSMQLGSSDLSDDNLIDYAGTMQQWKDSLAANADILLHCSNVAGDQGSALVQKLSQLTGADVAASGDLTGKAEGTDTDIEYATGEIEASLLFQPQPIATPSTLNTTYHALKDGALIQNWSDTSQITANNNWSNVPSIIGYRGDNLTSSAGVDPQTVVADPTTTRVNVSANRPSPSNLTTPTGVAEFDWIEVDNPTVALKGSDTADAPFLLIHLDTRGVSDVQVSYNLRDIDRSVNNARQQVALQYRVGTSGDFINVPEGFVADASTGPGQATLVTPVSVTLPSAVDNQSQVQVRIVTTNATGFDEWIGIDDINISSSLIPTAPALDLNGTAAGTNYNSSFTTGRGAVAIVDASNLSLKDDGSTINSATVRITNSLDGANEVLNAVTEGTNITASYTEGVLSLTGSDTVANYQTVLRSLTYNNSASNPDTTARTIEFVVNDGSFDSDIVTTTLAIFTPPTLDLNGAAADKNYNSSFTTGRGAVAIVDASNLSLSDDGSTLNSATVRITNQLDGANEVLSAVTEGTNITASYTDGVLSLTGSDTIANYQTVLRSLTYNNSASNPNTTARTIEFVVNDGSFDSDVVTTTLAVLIPPALDLNGAAAGTNYSNTFTTGRGAVAIVDASNLSLSDDGSTLNSATVRITNLLDGANEVLSAVTTGTNITASYSDGVLSLTGSDTIANYQTVLRSLTYNNSTTIPNNTSRTIEFAVNDGSAASDIATTTVAIITPPALDLNGAAAGTNYNGTFSRGRGAVAIVNASNLSLTNDGTIDSATVRITNRPNGANEVLSAVTTGTNITASYTDGVLSLTGSDTVANYQTVLRSLTYNNSTVIPNTASRTIEFVVNDSSATSEIRTTTLATDLRTTSLGGGSSNITPSTSPISRSGSVSNTIPDVLYPITLGANTRLRANLQPTGGNADIALLDSNGTVLRSSTNSGTGVENFSVGGTGLSAGNYFIRVYQATSGTTANYQLNLTFG